MEHPLVVGFILALYVVPVLALFGVGVWVAEKLEGSDES